MEIYTCKKKKILSEFRNPTMVLHWLININDDAWLVAEEMDVINIH